MASGSTVDKMTLDMTYLQKPSALLTLFSPTISKLQFIANKFATGFLYIPDELRSQQKILELMAHLFPYAIEPSLRPFHVYYEIGNFDGLVGFTNIIPEYRCGSFLKIWNPEIWGPTLARDLTELADRFMQEYHIKRMELETADERMVKVAKICGLKQEGTKALGFRFDGRLYTSYLLRKIKPGVQK
jgi:RimJ/RimL family protein N-acetyltransferase